MKSPGRLKRGYPAPIIAGQKNILIETLGEFSGRYHRRETDTLAPMGSSALREMRWDLETGISTRKAITPI